MTICRPKLDSSNDRLWTKIDNIDRAVHPSQRPPKLRGLSAQSLAVDVKHPFEHSRTLYSDGVTGNFNQIMIDRFQTISIPDGYQCFITTCHFGTYDFNCNRVNQFCTLIDNIDRGLWGEAFRRPLNLRGRIDEQTAYTLT